MRELCVVRGASDGGCFSIERCTQWRGANNVAGRACGGDRVVRVCRDATDCAGKVSCRVAPSSLALHVLPLRPARRGIARPRDAKRKLGRLTASVRSCRIPPPGMRTCLVTSLFHAIPFHFHFTSVFLHSTSARSCSMYAEGSTRDVGPSCLAVCAWRQLVAIHRRACSSRCCGTSRDLLPSCSVPFHSTSIPFQFCFQSTRPAPQFPVLSRSGHKGRCGERCTRRTGGRDRARMDVVTFISSHLPCRRSIPLRSSSASVPVMWLLHSHLRADSCLRAGRRVCVNTADEADGEVVSPGHAVSTRHRHTLTPPVG